MKSSFKKAYEKVTVDGKTVKLVYKAGRFGQHTVNTGGMAFLMLIGLFLTGAVTAGILAGMGMPGGVIIIGAFAVPIVASRMIFSPKTTSITVVANDGLVTWKGKQLPLSDITSIGFMHQTDGSNAKGTAYVYAEAYGTRVNVSGHVSDALASALQQEIKAASGASWN